MLNTDAPPPTTPLAGIELSNKLYNCTECSSLIEIISINEDNNIIEFKCLDKNKSHGTLIMPIKDYINKMCKYKNEKTNDDICILHNSEYISYCHDCNIHLCKNCLKDRTHINHYKNNIIEIEPIKEELEIIENIIKDYKNKIENLLIEKKNTIKCLENKLRIEKRIQNAKTNEKSKMYKNKQKNELKENNNRYKYDVEQITKRYENEIRQRKIKYQTDYYRINNKYKLLYERECIVNKFRLEKLDKKFKEKINNFQFDIKIENINNINIINELVYNTYKRYRNNYYNSININNILINYSKNDYINNNIMKKTLKNKYEDILPLILQKRNEDNSINI